MLKNIFLCGTAMLLLSSLAWAADPPPADVLIENPVPQTPAQSEQNPPDVMYLQEIPGQREHERILKAIQGKDPDVLRGELMPIQMQKMIQNRIQGDYWLGIECYPAMPVLRVHLDLPENQGLVVAKVIPDSPAAKAGIETHDILLAAGETKLTSVEELSKTVESAKETPLKLDILHAGKPKTVEITPAKRPQNAMFRPEGTPADWREIDEWMQKMRSGAAPNQPRQMRFRFIQPGAILPFNVPALPPMPGNMSININRQGDQPAKISVTWNDKHWDITENKLDKLPPEVRPHVERMLGEGKLHATAPGAGGVSAEALDPTMPAPPPGMPGAPGSQMQVQPLKSLEDRLDEMNRKIDAIKKELEKNRGDNEPVPQAENLTPEANPQPQPPEEPAE